MKTFADLQAARIHAMKNDKSRLPALSLLMNEVRQIAKNDGNRDVRDDDLITASTRTIKRAKESISTAREGTDTSDLELEIAIAQEFLPQQMSEDDLKAEIEKVLDTTERDKKARGVVMKHLNSNYRGQFDAAKANEYLSSVL